MTPSTRPFSLNQTVNHFSTNLFQYTLLLILLEYFEFQAVRNSKLRTFPLNVLMSFDFLEIVSYICPFIDLVFMKAICPWKCCNDHPFPIAPLHACSVLTFSYCMANFLTKESNLSCHVISGISWTVSV